MHMQDGIETWKYTIWSIFSYMYDDFKPEAYWINTSINEIIAVPINNVTDEVYQNMATLPTARRLLPDLILLF